MLQHAFQGNVTYRTRLFPSSVGDYWFAYRLNVDGINDYRMKNIPSLIEW